MGSNESVKWGIRYKNYNRKLRFRKSWCWGGNITFYKHFVWNNISLLLSPRDNKHILQILYWVFFILKLSSLLNLERIIQISKTGMIVLIFKLIDRALISMMLNMFYAKEDVYTQKIKYNILNVNLLNICSQEKNLIGHPPNSAWK